jgi:hypothetical protein
VGLTKSRSLTFNQNFKLNFIIMKTRIILFLAISAVTTLSFTFVSLNNAKQVKAEKSVKNAISEPTSGLMGEDKI